MTHFELEFDGDGFALISSLPPQFSPFYLAVVCNEDCQVSEEAREELAVNPFSFGTREDVDFEGVY